MYVLLMDCHVRWVIVVGRSGGRTRWRRLCGEVMYYLTLGYVWGANYNMERDNFMK